MNELKKIEKGDILWADRRSKGLPFDHCGIYEGNGNVIHYAAPDGIEIKQKNAIIHRTTYEIFKDGCKVKIYRLSKGYSPEETVQRARSRLNEKDYNFTLNNCDHFATWCKTGEHLSLQVNQIKKIMSSFGVFGDIFVSIYEAMEDNMAPNMENVEFIRNGLNALSELKKYPEPPHLNIKIQVIDGEVFWKNIEIVNGWKLQRNNISKHYRILNPHKIRIVYGSRKKIEEYLNDILS